MLTCANCGQDNPEGARFCNACASPLAGEEHRLREERKVVTVLFADLVGFTSRAERMDPEDVRELLSPYYARLRGELEHFGGTVEKFIGDAVMALFGAPLAHEDDPERAVRAAFAIRDWVRERSGSRSGSPSTPARRSSRSTRARRGRGDGRRRRRQHDRAAPERRARERDPRRREHLPGDAARDRVPRSRAGRGQGQGEPIAVWEALQARASLGVDVPLEARTALVGRERELGVVRDALAALREERSPQLVTLVGVPGIGKSRLLYELSQIVDAEPDLISWRQGRSLPYGEGVSFWALAEMVKAQAGMLETDDVAEAEAKLAQTVADVIAVPADAEWVRRHLRHARRPAGPTSRSAATSAARRSPPGGASSRRSPSSGRSCSCSRTCTGPTTACSTSSTTSSTGPPRCRSSSSAPRARSCSSAGRAGAGARRTRPRSRSRRSRTTTRRG